MFLRSRASFSTLSISFAFYYYIKSACLYSCYNFSLCSVYDFSDRILAACSASFSYRSLKRFTWITFLSFFSFLSRYSISRWLSRCSVKFETSIFGTSNLVTDFSLWLLKLFEKLGLSYNWESNVLWLIALRKYGLRGFFTLMGVMSLYSSMTDL